MNVLHELITQITSAEMPDHDYPAFRLFKKDNMVHAEFSWRDIEVNVIGTEEDTVILEAAMMFMFLTMVLTEVNI